MRTDPEREKHARAWLHMVARCRANVGDERLQRGLMKSTTVNRTTEPGDRRFKSCRAPHLIKKGLLNAAPFVSPSELFS